MYDPAKAFALVATTPAASEVSPFSPNQLAISGNTLLWLEKAANGDVLNVCTLPSCTPITPTATSKLLGFMFAIANGRVYFETSVMDSCNVANSALASCSLASLAANACTPQIHATDLRILGAKALSVGATTAVVTGQNGSTYRVTL